MTPGLETFKSESQCLEHLISARSRPPPGATIPFVPDTDIAAIFGQLEPLLKANLSILAALDVEMESWAGSVEGDRGRSLSDRSSLVSNLGTGIEQ